MELPTFLSSQPWTAHKLSTFLMGQQEIAGVGFDEKGAKELHTTISELMLTIEQEVEPQLPERELGITEKKLWKFPAKPFNQDGSHSAFIRKWIEKTGATLVDDVTVELEGQRYTIVGNAETKTRGAMTLSNQEALKQWLVESEGWKPTFWNVKKDKRNKPIRDENGKQIPTTPKLQDKGVICPNLMGLQGDLVKQVVRWLSLRNRRSVIEGWLENPRLAIDGRIGAAASGVTPTFRAKHSIICNGPKAIDSVLFGKEMRGLFCVREDIEPGKVLVGWDASGLEDRIEAHFTSQFDGGAYATKILDPSYDAHQENADAWGITRQQAKSGTYALAYNCMPPTLAKTLNCTLTEAKRRHEAYWEINWPLRQLEEHLVKHWETWGEKKYIKGIDGRKLHVRNKNAIVNTLIQSTGAIIFDYALIWLDKKLGPMYDVGVRPHYLLDGYEVERIIYYHDEAEFRCDKEVAEKVLQLGTDSVKWAGEFFKLKVPLLSEGNIGMSWRDLK